MKHEKQNNEGVFTDNGTFCVDTGLFTGRSPKDKWIGNKSIPMKYNYIINSSYLYI